MRKLLLPFWWFYCIYSLLVFIAGMLCVLPFVAFFSLQGEIKGGNRIYHICRWWDTVWLALCGIRPSNSFESVPDPGKQYVFIANHISYLDIPMILQAVRRNSFRILGKAEMAKVPLFGYIYRRAVILVDRNSANGRSKSVRELKSLLNAGISIFLFPEGTFNETGGLLKEFYDGAFRIAIETQTPLQPILFPDTLDRMFYSSVFCLRPGRSRAVFLAEVPVAGLSLADLPDLKTRVYRMMEEGLLRWKA